MKRDAFWILALLPFTAAAHDAAFEHVRPGTCTDMRRDAGAACYSKLLVNTWSLTFWAPVSGNVRSRCPVSAA